MAVQNLFSLLNLPVDFALDGAALEQAYFRAQREFHPDRQAGKSSSERQQAIFASMDANNAYQTLKSPVKRAQHLLALQGILVNADTASSVKPATALLMEMMEWREKLADCHTEEAWQSLYDAVVQMQQDAEAKFAEAYQHAAWQDAAQQAIRLRYVEKMNEEMRLHQMRHFEGR
jgi:molecular chaperone HscB